MTAYLILSFTPAAILLGLTAVFIRRKLYRDFPFFSGYIAFALLATASRLSVLHKPVAYFVLYWTSEAIYGVLALLSLNEVLKHLFESDYEQYWWFRLVLPAAALLMALLFLRQPLRPTASARITNAVFSFDLGIHSLQVLILVLFVILDKVFTAASDQYDYGIVRGFGVSACITIFADLALSHFGSGNTFYFTYAPPVGYIAATLIWLHAFVRRPPPRQKLPITIRELLEMLGKQAEVAAKMARNWRPWRYSQG
jgi:hypothetical protein